MAKKTKTPATPKAPPPPPKKPVAQAKAAPEAHRSGKPTNPFIAQKPPRLDGRRR